MPHILLKPEGKTFIKEMGKKWTEINGSRSMIEGKHNYGLPFSSVKTDPSIIWKANVIDYNGNIIVNNTQFAEFLIQSFNNNAQFLNLDANIIAAQAFHESKYKTWEFAEDSDASGISQFRMITVYDSIYNKNKNFLGTDEKNKIIKNLELPDQPTSWHGVKTVYTPVDIERQEKNRTILHQNIIDNPDIMIKLQSSLMSYISNNNGNLASSSLFAYTTGSENKSKNYVELINITAKNSGNERAEDGVNYVEKIFGYLGDRYHTKKIKLEDITKGFWFGYNMDFSFDNFSADVASSERGITIANVADLVPELNTGYINAKKDFETKYKDQYIVELESVYRTARKQYELYQKGRNDRGEIVNSSEVETPIDGYVRKSYHNYYKAKAFDYKIYDLVKGIYVTGDRNDLSKYVLHQEFAAMVKIYVPNSVWGGTFKDHDPIHIELA